MQRGDRPDKRLDGLKEIAHELAAATGETFSIPTISRLIRRPLDPLPSFRGPSGRVYAWRSAIQEWAKQAGLRWEIFRRRLRQNRG